MVFIRLRLWVYGYYCWGLWVVAFVLIQLLYISLLGLGGYQLWKIDMPLEASISLPVGAWIAFLFLWGPLWRGLRPRGIRITGIVYSRAGFLVTLINKSRAPRYIKSVRLIPSHLKSKTTDAAYNTVRAETLGWDETVTILVPGPATPGEKYRVDIQVLLDDGPLDDYIVFTA